MFKVHIIFAAPCFRYRNINLLTAVSISLSTWLLIKYRKLRHKPVSPAL